LILELSAFSRANFRVSYLARFRTIDKQGLGLILAIENNNG